MTLLVVDDDADTRLLVRLLLEAEGFTDIVTADSAVESIHLVERNAGRIDLVLMNVRMPDMDGIEATRRLKQVDAARDVPVIMLTTQTGPEVLERAYAAGAMDYVSKPLERTQLLVRVRSALALKTATDQRKARERELTALTQRLEQTVQALDSDVKAAARLQRRLLPDPLHAPPGVAWDWRFIPCDAIGGDLLNAALIAPGVVGMYLLDVCGHGVPAALHCVGLHRLLSAGGVGYLVAADGRPRPVNAVAAQLNCDFQMGDEDFNYFTMVYASLDIASRTLDYVQAGHPGMALLQPGEPAAYAGEGDLPIGLLPQTVFHPRRARLAPGTRVLLYSDGVIEAARPSDGELFGRQRLLARIEELRHASLGEMLDGIVQSVDDWTAPGRQIDDVSLLVLALQ
jgi:sigma-B regulation protein RsbU (phosphoserine phosphatase)